MQKILGLIIAYTAWAAFDCVNVFLIYDKFLPAERKKADRMAFFRMALVFAVSVAYGLVNERVFGGEAVFFLLAVPFFFKAFLVVRSFFYGKAKDILVIFLYQLFTEIISLGFRLISHGRFDVPFYKAYCLYEVAAAAFAALLLLCGIFFRKNSLLRIYFSELTAFQYAVICIALFVSDFIGVGIYSRYPDDQMLQTLAALNILAACLLMGQLILVRESDVRKSRAIDVLDGQMEKVTEYYNEMAELEEKTRKFRHDIKNLLLALHAMVENGENDEALAYIEKMGDMCRASVNKFDTGNFVADALLSAKSATAERTGTAISFHGYMPGEMDNVDMVILLSNILDNALEACAKLEGEKAVRIESVLQKRIWVLRVENPAPENVKIRKNRIETTKSNKAAHGFGIRNMERVVRKYNGSLQLACEGGAFTVKAMLQMNRELRNEW